MCSWCRIAWRCGDLEASSNGGAGGASATRGRRVVVVRDGFDLSVCVSAASPSRRLSCYPEILAGPLLRPLGGDSHVVAVVDRVRRREDLDETFDLETGVVKKVDPVAVGEVVFGSVLARPVHAVDPRLRAGVLLTHAEDAPGGLVRRPRLGRVRIGVVGVRPRPVRDVAGD